MSLYDYKLSTQIEAEDYPFYAMVMALMRRADTDNARKLKAAFPEISRELQERYNAPGGSLEEDFDGVHCGSHLSFEPDLTD